MDKVTHLVIGESRFTKSSYLAQTNVAKLGQKNNIKPFSPRGHRGNSHFSPSEESHDELFSYVSFKGSYLVYASRVRYPS